MQNLIELIKVAIAPDAKPDERVAGVEACRTIIRALTTSHEGNRQTMHTRPVFSVPLVITVQP